MACRAGPGGGGAYCLDTSALIDAYYRTYLPGAFPGVWRAIERLAGAGVAVASAEVRQELSVGGHELHEWAKSVPGMFVETDERIIALAAEVCRSYANLVQPGSAKSKADPFVIAVARERSCAVITCERATNNMNGPRIPDVCRAMGIRLVSIAQMLEEQRITL